MKDSAFENFEKNVLYDAVVIGAGPGGLSVVGNLLDHDVNKILWIDPEFQSGRIACFPNVPSNTKVKLFTRYVELCKTFTEIAETYKGNPEKDPLGDLRSLNPEKGCELRFAGDMIRRLTKGIEELYHDKVRMQRGWVREVHGHRKENSRILWEIILDNQSETFFSECVIFSTGSHPRSLKGDASFQKKYGKINEKGEYLPKEIFLEDAFEPETLQKLVGPEDVVAVVGTSHSGILVLKNLSELPNRPKEIKSFYHKDLIYAVYYEDWILYDNTGLKEVAAEWAKTMFETNKVPNLHKYKYNPESEMKVCSKEIPECTKIIYAIGYERNELPKITIQDTHIKDKEITYERTTGQFIDSRENKNLPGLYGYGIAFPERVVDNLGNVEESVGFLKFMRYHNRVIPTVVVPFIKNSREYFTPRL